MTYSREEHREEIEKELNNLEEIFYKQGFDFTDEIRETLTAIICGETTYDEEAKKTIEKFRGTSGEAE